ncbi:MAG TPA: hypothetical protein VGM98_04770 [Schlesneria sp.]
MATISINLDDKATAGLKTLTDTLQNLSTGSAELSEQQAQQITIVQQSTQDWKTFGSTVVTANAHAQAEAAKMIGKVAELADSTVHAVYGAEEFAFAVGTKVTDALIKGGLMVLKYTLLTKGAVEVIKAVKGTSNEAAEATDKQGNSFLSTASKATAFGVALATVTGQWESIGQASTAVGIAAVRTFSGLGPVITAGTILLTGYEAVMARTGERVDELGNKTTNLDRIQKAASGVGEEIGNVGSELVGNLKQIALATSPLVEAIGSGLTQAWKDVDTVATRTADNNIKSLNNIREALSGVTQEQREAIEKLEAQREKEKDGFAALRDANERLAADESQRARTAQIASIATVAGVEKEITAVREAAATQARAGNVQKGLYEELKALELQKTKILQTEETARVQSLQKSLEQRKQFEAEYAKSQWEAQLRDVKQFQEAYDKEKKILEGFYDFRRNLVFDARNEDLKTAEALIKQSGEEAKAKANLLEGDKKDVALKQAQRDTEGALHALKIKGIEEELKQATAAAKSEDDVRKANYDYQRKRAAAEAAFNREVMVQKLQDRQAESDKAIAIEKAKQAALKNTNAEALGKAGFNAQDLLSNANGKDVQKALQQQARDRAKQYVNANNEDLRKQAEFDNGGAADQQLKRLQKQAQDEAAQTAGRRFRQGKTDPTDLINAQAQVANQTLVEQAAQGNVSGNTLQAVQEQLKAVAANAAATAAQQQTIDRMKKDLANVTGAAVANAQRARAQANSL